MPTTSPISCPASRRSGLQACFCSSLQLLLIMGVVVARICKPLDPAPYSWVSVLSVVSFGLLARFPFRPFLRPGLFSFVRLFRGQQCYKSPAHKTGSTMMAAVIEWECRSKRRFWGVRRTDSYRQGIRLALYLGLTEAPSVR